MNEDNHKFDELENLKNKTMFLFLPKNVVFEKRQESDNDFSSALKSISPFFYWCSGHEFKEFDKDHRFLIQYQTFNIENNKIVAGDLIQKWSHSKNIVRNEVINFIEHWDDHERMLLNNSKIVNFLQFGEYVATCIFNVKDVYINEVSNIGYDLMKKDFWKTMALNNPKTTKNKKTTKSKKVIKNKKTTKSKKRKDNV